jgi:hypothetical protein
MMRTEMARTASIPAGLSSAGTAQHRDREGGDHGVSRAERLTIARQLTPGRHEPTGRW